MPTLSASPLEALSVCLPWPDHDVAFSPVVSQVRSDVLKTSATLVAKAQPSPLLAEVAIVVVASFAAWVTAVNQEYTQRTEMQAVRNISKIRKNLIHVPRSRSRSRAKQLLDHAKSS